MRALLIVGNNNMSTRELYTAVLDSHSAGWTSSFMSGLPEGIESIAGSFDLVAFELGRADSSERVAAAGRIRSAGVEVITHVEGREADRLRDELLHQGVVVVSNPLNADRIAEAVDQVASRRRSNPRRVGARERIRRFLGR